MASPLAALVDDYIAATNAYQPVGASTRGFHQHDARLGDRSRTALEDRMRYVRAMLARLASIDPATLTGNEPYDADLLKRRLAWEITDFEQVRSWQRAPGAPLATIGSGCNGLVIRDFAPLPERIASLIARLGEVPALLAQAKENLVDPTRYHIETAIESAAGMRALFERDLPAAAAAAGDPALLRRFDAANDAARTAVADYAAWLKAHLLPRAREDVAWGAANMRALLSETDSIDEPLDTLIARGEEDLRAHQARLQEVAAKLDPAATPAAVIEAVSGDHPAAAELLPHVRALLEDLRQFSIDARICTMPTDVRISVRETPGFSRMTTQAACSTPGPFERVATEAYYYVTPPDTAWPADRTEAYLRFFNRWSIPGVTAHEAYPGHYVHLTYLQRASSAAGRYLLSITPVEGWAHYVEQVMIEEGYGAGEPRIELMQVREALLRLCRYRCAFGLHAENWSYRQAVDFFAREGYATPVIAERETRRGIIGPNYYAYTMGKHQILRLREKVRAKQGAAYDQARFHDQLMQLPYPVSSIERIMLGGA
ncbi:MAG TPA: DUF885 domain-containing protein [Dehalococcoidia bacterium]|nr:DUF885 domain-containing protein [Dehalococcoidia bacterium]